MVRSIEVAGIVKHPNSKSKGIGFFVAAVVLVNFLSETVHGILTRELGTENYASLSVGEMSKGLLFVFLVGHFRWGAPAVRWGETAMKPNIRSQSAVFV